MNPYTETYKNLTSSKLLEIIRNKSDYNQAAYEAAVAEFERRNLAPPEMEMAEQEVNLKAQFKHEKETKKAELNKKVKSSVDVVLQSLNPFDKGYIETNLLTKVIIATLLVLSILRYYYNITFLPTIFDFNQKPADLIISWAYFLPLFVFIGGAILFNRDKKIGWYLLFAYAVFELAGILSFQIWSFLFNYMDSDASLYLDHIGSTYFLIEIFAIYISVTALRNLFRSNIITKYEVNYRWAIGIGIYLLLKSLYKFF